ncbi:HD domain-containing phosphohydrolase [uncultured Shewanella sp.]|uniref:HD-GYP domain-containing protein n=1 Tax=uncultured Shewanella sp. TaxID=173975 RepID=UPI002628C5F4|nr:HD domain-containing phosphohydrolase [uncultured Shewanella sp.]
MPHSDNSYDPCKPDCYMEHLAAVNKKMPVVAVEGIYNEFGVLLVPKDANIERRVLDFLVGHKMQKNLDCTIGIKGCLTNDALLRQFKEFLSKYPDLTQIHRTNNFDVTLKHLCTVQQVPRILLQTLTILREQLPNIFEQTLFSSWLGSMIAIEMELPPNQVQNVFNTGLFHDLGLLHIDPKIVNKEGSYSEDEWLAIKHHMIISKAIVAEVTACDEEVLRGIMEHHERCDGTGYPHELLKSKLSYCGQIIGLADILFHIRTRQLSRLGRNMADIVPYLQINSNTFMFESYQAIHNIIYRSYLRVTDLINRKDFSTLPQRLIAQRIKLKKLYKDLHLFTEKLSSCPHGKHSKSFINSSNHIFRTFNRSGLSSPEIMLWLQKMSEEDFDSSHLELQEVDTMQYELLWMIKRASRLLPELISDEVRLSENDRSLITRMADQLRQDLNDAWESYD